MKRLLLQTTWGGMVISGLLTICTTNTWAACIAKNDCAELGYKYSAAECSGEGLACVFDPTRYNCANPCTYTIAASTCSSRCKNVGTKSCSRGGATYYEACGSSKCSSGQTCNNGTCVSTCNYTITKASCDSQCKNVGTKSCTKNGTTYYESCGASKCSNGQICSGGTCKTVPTSGSCCGYSQCGYSGTSHPGDSKYCQDAYGMSCYNKCIQLNGVSCDEMQASCTASGGYPRFRWCLHDDDSDYFVVTNNGTVADFSCE